MNNHLTAMYLEDSDQIDQNNDTQQSAPQKQPPKMVAPLVELQKLSYQQDQIPIVQSQGAQQQQNQKQQNGAEAYYSDDEEDDDDSQQYGRKKKKEKEIQYYNQQDLLTLEVNPQLKEGPLIIRKCTDLWCCWIFILFIIVMITIACLGFVYDRLTVPYDPNGRACGYDEGVEDAPFTYIAVPYKGYFHRNVCVKKCPTWDKDQAPLTTLDCIPNKEVTTCFQTFSDTCNFPDGCTSSNTLSQSVFIYNTTAYFGRICLSNNKEIRISTQLSDVFAITRLQEYFSDLFVARWALTGTAFIAYSLGLIFCIMMIFQPNIVTWVGIVFYFINVTLLGVFFMTKAQSLKESADETSDPTSKDVLETDSINLRALSYTMFIVLVLSFVGLICMFKQIRLAIVIIKSSQHFVQDTLEILAVPAVTGILMIGLIAFWIVIYLFVFSAGELKGGRRDGPFATIVWNKEWRHMLWFWLLGGLWILNTFLCVNQFIMSSSTCIWYFSQPYHRARRPVLQSIYRAFRFHLGSLLLGAAVLPFVQIIRILFAYLEKQVKQADKARQQGCLMTWCACCIGCFECWLKYMNKTAYIYIGLTGESFYSSAKYAYNLIERNAGKYGTVIGIGQVFVFIGKCLIAVSNTFIIFMILSYLGYFKNNLFSPLLPSIFCLVYSYMIANLFMSVFGLSLDAILQCACLDEELYQAEGEAAQHTPEELINFFIQYKDDNFGTKSVASKTEKNSSQKQDDSDQDIEDVI